MNIITKYTCKYRYVRCESLYLQITQL